MPTIKRTFANQPRVKLELKVFPVALEAAGDLVRSAGARESIHQHSVHRHEIVLESTARVYVRLRGPEQDLLLPGINGGRAGPPAEVVAGEGSIWELGLGDLRTLVRGSEGQQAKLATWLARDNRFRGSTAQLVPMNRVLMDRFASSALRAHWRKSTESATTYRDLLPRDKADTGPIEFHNFFLPGDSIDEQPGGSRRIYSELGGGRRRWNGVRIFRSLR